MKSHISGPHAVPETCAFCITMIIFYLLHHVSAPIHSHPFQGRETHTHNPDLYTFLLLLTAKPPSIQDVPGALKALTHLLCQTQGQPSPWRNHDGERPKNTTYPPESHLPSCLKYSSERNPARSSKPQHRFC